MPFRGHPFESRKRRRRHSVISVSLSLALALALWRLDVTQTCISREHWRNLCNNTPRPRESNSDAMWRRLRTERPLTYDGQARARLHKQYYVLSIFGSACSLWIRELRGALRATPADAIKNKRSNPSPRCVCLALLRPAIPRGVGERVGWLFLVRHHRGVVGVFQKHTHTCACVRASKMCAPKSIWHDALIIRTTRVRKQPARCARVCSATTTTAKTHIRYSRTDRHVETLLRNEPSVRELSHAIHPRAGGESNSKGHFGSGCLFCIPNLCESVQCGRSEDRDEDTERRKTIAYISRANNVDATHERRSHLCITVPVNFHYNGLNGSLIWREDVASDALCAFVPMSPSLNHPIKCLYPSLGPLHIVACTYM